MKNISKILYQSLSLNLENQTSAKVYSGPIINPWWLTGFSDAESSFKISIYKNKEYACGWQVQAHFCIELHIKDLPLLVNIKNYLGVGTICTRGNRLTAIYTVSSLEELTNVIIPHFTKYPLLTQKSADFLLFQKAVEIMVKKEHRTLEGVSKILNIRASMNKGLTDTLKSHFPDFIPVERPIVSLSDILDVHWVVGFCDGESNFDIRISQSNKYSNGHQVQLRFRVSQHNRDILLLTKLVEFFNCGSIDRLKTKQAAIFTVTSFKDINTIIISFFEKITLLGIKSLDFQDFNKVAKLISSGDHLTISGLEKIKSIKAGINSKRTF